MIIEKNGVLERVPTPLEPPPDYTFATNNPRLPLTPLPLVDAQAGPSSSSLRLPAIRRPPLSPGKGKTWFSFLPGPQDIREKEVRATVIGLVRDLVRQPYDEAALSILDSCAEGCAAVGISLSSVLQDKSIEGRTPLYWATVKLAGPSADSATSGERALVSALAAHSMPLRPGTISEIRLACVAASDNALYQEFRGLQGFGVMSGADRMILGEEYEAPADRVVVEDVAEDMTAFVASVSFPLFQRRMRAGGKVGCAFIARGRLFNLVIHVPPGPSVFWVVSLSLGEHSAPTHLDSRLIIEDQSPPPEEQLLTGGRSPRTTPFKPKLRPTISLRMKTGSQKLGHMSNSEGVVPELSVKLEDSLMASSLQYENCPYITSSGTLEARFEAKLARPEADCIIC